MREITQRGLQGKARRVRHRNRAERLHQQQMLNEYFMPESKRRSSQYIPIRGRGEFLPSAVPPVELSDGQPDRQLMVPLSRHDKNGSSASTVPSKDTPRSSREKAATRDGVKRHVASAGTSPKRAAIRNDRREKALRFVPDERPRLSLPIKPPEQMHRKGKSFTLRGFLTGCAMGGVAAGFALLVLQTLVL